MIGQIGYFAMRWALQATTAIAIVASILLPSTTDRVEAVASASSVPIEMASPYTSKSAILDVPSADELESSLDGIFGPDDRREISATTTQPWSMVVLLITIWRSGEISQCSGFMIGVRTVGTAGHCVYQADQGGWPSRILAVPGATGRSEPFGSSFAVSTHSVSGWINDGDLRYDIGAVRLDSDLGTKTGMFGMRVDSDATLMSSTVAITGFPGDKSVGTMWQATGTLDSVDSFSLFYRIDATFGNSGGPIWGRTAEGQFFVLGIVSSGNDLRSRGVRMSSAVIDRFGSWISGTGITPSASPAPSVAVTGGGRPGVSVATPSVIKGPSRSTGLTVLAIGAPSRQGVLAVSAQGGVLIANGALTPRSCGAGGQVCLGVAGSYSDSVLVPDQGNDINVVMLTLQAAIGVSSAIRVTASQNGVSWDIVVPVQAIDSTAVSTVAAPSVTPSGATARVSVPLPTAGLGLTVFSGGTSEQLVVASGCPAADVVFWATNRNAGFVIYVPGAVVAAVNAEWLTQFSDGIPPNTPVIGRCASRPVPPLGTPSPAVAPPVANLNVVAVCFALASENPTPRECSDRGAALSIGRPWALFANRRDSDLIVVITPAGGGAGTTFTARPLGDASRGYRFTGTEFVGLGGGAYRLTIQDGAGRVSASFEFRLS